MGGEIYYYFVSYQKDIEAALQALRKQEFEAGRYNPAISFPFDRGAQSFGEASGAKHGSIREALEASEADGTRSILDLERIGSSADFGVCVELSAEELEELYGTARPSRAMVKENMDFFEDIERGQGIYFIVYDGDRPLEILFAGISYD